MVTKQLATRCQKEREKKNISIYKLFCLESIFCHKPKKQLTYFPFLQDDFFDWRRPKSSKYGTGPTQERKMTGSAQHIENG